MLWTARMLCRLSIAVNKAGWALAPWAWDYLMTEECARYRRLDAARNRKGGK